MEDKLRKQMREWIIIKAIPCSTEGSDPERGPLFSYVLLSRMKRILVIFISVVLLLIIN